MKRNFLLMLLLTLLPLAGWSATVKVGTVTVTQSANYVVLTPGTTVTPPTITLPDGYTLEEGVFAYDASKFKYVAVALNEIVPGTYFQKLVKESETLYVPFQVATKGVMRTDASTPNDYDFVTDQASWNQSKANGGLNAYYAANPDEDNYVFASPAAFAADEEAGGHYAQFNDKFCDFLSYGDAEGTQKFGVGKVQMIWINSTTAYKMKVTENARQAGVTEEQISDEQAQSFVNKEYFVTKTAKADGTLYPLYTDESLQNATGIWVKIVEGPYYDPTSTKQSWWGAINASGAQYPWIVMNTRDDAVRPVFTYKNAVGATTTDANDYEVLPWGLKAIKNYGCASLAAEFVDETFNQKNVSYKGNDDILENFSIALLPDIAAFPLAPSVEFNGANTQGPGFVLVGEGTDSEDYTVNSKIKNFNNNEEGIKGVGEYYYVIEIKVGDVVKRTINSAKFKVTGHVVAINASQTTKQYGQPDPAPNYQFDAASLMGDDTAEDLNQWLVFKRATDNEGEDCREYNYYIAYSDDYIAGKCDYEIKILQRGSILEILPAPLTITIADAYTTKVFGADEPAYNNKDNYEVTGLKNGDTKDNLDITISRAAGDNAGTYKFSAKVLKGEYENYAVTVVPENFTITPKTDGLAIVFTAKDNDYKYTGNPVEPTFDVYDGDTKLTADDIATKEWTNNVNVVRGLGSEYPNNVLNGATATATLKGNYAGATVTAQFAVQPQTLTITADDQEITNAQEPAAVEWTYSGWVNDEDETKLSEEYFKAPDGGTIEADPKDNFAMITKVNQNAWALNYNIEYKDGVVAIDRSILTVTVTSTSKIFGTADPETFEVTVEGLHGGDTKESVLKVGTWVYTITREGAGTEAGENVGTYALNITGPDKLKDYKVKYVDGRFTINPAEMYIVAEDANKTYGQADPNFTLYVATRSGEGTEEKPYEYTKVIGVSIPNGVRAAHPNNFYGAEDAGEQAILVQRNVWGRWIEITNWTSGNYTFNGVNGKLTIAKVDVTLTPVDNEKNYGVQADPVLKVTPDPLGTYTWGAEAVDYNQFTITREEGEDAGTYNITLALKKDSEGKDIAIGDKTAYGPNNVFRNYNVTLATTPGTFTIKPLNVKVKANDQVINYAQAINPYDVTITIGGEVQEWTEEAIAKVVRLETTVKHVGATANAYTAVVPNQANANYTFNPETDFTNGYLTIYPLTTIPLGQAALTELVGDKVSLAEVLEDHKGTEVTVILPKRAMNPDDWYEWVLPFDATPRDFFSTPYGETEYGFETRWGYGAIDVLDVNKTQNGKVVFDITVNKIPANTPFLVKIDKKITSADMATIAFEGVTIANKDADGNEVFYFKDGEPVKPEVESKDGSVKFVGLYEDKTGVDGNQMFLAQVDPKPKREFYRGDDDRADMQAIKLIRTKAYLEFPTVADAVKAQIFIEEADGSYTAINGVEAENKTVDAEGIYNLSGQRVNKAQKGIYIMDGKKVLVK